MAQHPTKQNRKIAFKFVGFQFLVASVLSILVTVLWEVQHGLWFFIGAMIDVLPSFVFTIYAFRFSGAQQIDMIAASMYRGEAMKMMLTGLLFILVLKTFPVILPALFIGFFTLKVSQFLQTFFF